jgi:thiol-disulfide isomerase/thioredoxin
MDFSIYIRYLFGVFTTLLQKFKSILEKYKILIVILIVMFIVIGIIFYKKYIFPKINKTYADNNEFVSTNKKDDNTTTLYFFYTNWCPKCKLAQSEWNAFKNDTQGVFNGVNITFIEVDCDVDTAIADTFKIVGYPTIKLVYKDKIYEYDAKTDRELLAIFLGDIFKNP